MANDKDNFIKGLKNLIIAIEKDDIEIMLGSYINVEHGMVDVPDFECEGLMTKAYTGTEHVLINLSYRPKI